MIPVSARWSEDIIGTVITDCGWTLEQVWRKKTLGEAEANGSGAAAESGSEGLTDVRCSTLVTKVSYASKGFRARR